MIETEVELRRILGATPLANRQILSIRIRKTNRTALAIEISSSEVLAMWKVGRGLVPRTKRYPLVMAPLAHAGDDWKETMARDGEDLFMRHLLDPSVGSLDMRASAILRRADSVNARAFLAAAMEDSLDLEDDEDAENDIGMTEHLEWFSWPLTALVFLPTARSASALAYAEWWASAGRDPAPFVAVLRYWRERWGAELVAHYSTMLGFIVKRPPRDVLSAKELAREQIALAPHTVALGNVTLQDHADALIERKTWWLHNRP